MKRRPVKEQRLDQLEGEFRPPLVACLTECAKGRYGLFGQNDKPEIAKYYEWPEAEELKQIALEIKELRAEFGQPNALVEQLLHYCSLRGSNVPGEPKLARAFLDEILKDATEPNPR